MGWSEFPESGHVKDEGEGGWLSLRVSEEALKWPSGRSQSQRMVAH